jgi:hypothetical protein
LQSWNRLERVAPHSPSTDFHYGKSYGADRKK